MSLIGEGGDKRVRMAQPRDRRQPRASTASPRCIRELLRETVLRDFAELWPERFHNVTNGVTPRRFVALRNPRLAALLDRERSATAGSADLDAAARARGASPTTPAFQERWRAVKRANKEALARRIRERTGDRRRPGRAVRRAGQAHPRVQAPAPEPAARRSRCTTACARDPTSTSRRARSCSAARPRPATAWRS